MKSLIPAENWEYSLKDLFVGLGTAFAKKKTQTVLDLESISGIPIRSGRAAIYAAIKALNLPLNAKIAVPLFSCPAVFKAVIKAGCSLVFVDVESDTYCMSATDLRKKIGDVDAIIAIHMFGHNCDMSALQNAAQGKPIIEDCAQSLGSKINGRLTGTWGDIGIFSFRSGKYLSVGEGGALYSKHAELMSRFERLVNDMHHPSTFEEFKHVVKTYLRTKLRTRPLFGWVGKPLWKLYNRKVDFTSKTPIKLSQMFRHDVRLTQHRFKQFQQMVGVQRQNSEYFLQELGLDFNMLPFEKPGMFYNRYAFPIAFPSTEWRDAMANYLLNKKIDTIKPYQDMPKVAAHYFGYSGDCPVTERIAKTILLLPNYYTLKSRELEHIVKNVNRAWNALLNERVTEPSFAQ